MVSLVSGNLGCIGFVLCMLLGMGLVSRGAPAGEPMDGMTRAGAAACGSAFQA